MGIGLTRCLKLQKRRNWRHLKSHRQGWGPWVTITQVAQDCPQFNSENPASSGSIAGLHQPDSWSTLIPHKFLKATGWAEQFLLKAYENSVHPLSALVSTMTGTSPREEGKKVLLKVRQPIFQEQKTRRSWTVGNQALGQGSVATPRPWGRVHSSGGPSGHLYPSAPTLTFEEVNHR